MITEVHDEVITLTLRHRMLRQLRVLTVVTLGGSEPSLRLNTLQREKQDDQSFEVCFEVHDVFAGTNGRGALQTLLIAAAGLAMSPLHRS
ncbi:MAG: hypothetical protein MUE46_10720 [Xanthomonadales bacterium]|nr:hypothetical protein [Xanthomonadales bacterium]